MVLWLCVIAGFCGVMVATIALRSQPRESYGQWEWFGKDNGGGAEQILHRKPLDFLKIVLGEGWRTGRDTVVTHIYPKRYRVS